MSDIHQLNIQNKLLQIKNEELQSKIIILEKHIHELLNKPIETSDSIPDSDNKFGNGKIRYTQNNKCYHGCLNTDGTWFQNHFKGEEHFFWEYKPDYIWKKRHCPGIFDTKNANEFCSNCEISHEFSKRKKTHKVYRCLGHDL
tara:strand:+ start:79 stop:507 length:429 start_codon:yes stop_codon:yes gene_type:complete